MDCIGILAGLRSVFARREGVQLLWLAIAWFAIREDTLAQPSPRADFEVKALNLVKFTQYTTWPSNTFASTSAPVIIGVLGAEPLFGSLQELAAAFSGSRPVQIRRVTTVEEAEQCHVVFIGETESRKESDWFGRLKEKPILTVGESDRSLERGAVMRFVIRRGAGWDTVRFEADLAAAAVKKLELHEGMLRSAVYVRRRPRE